MIKEKDQLIKAKKHKKFKKYRNKITNHKSFKNKETGTLPQIL